VTRLLNLRQTIFRQSSRGWMPQSWFRQRRKRCNGPDAPWRAGAMMVHGSLTTTPNQHLPPDDEADNMAARLIDADWRRGTDAEWLDPPLPCGPLPVPGCSMKKAACSPRHRPGFTRACRCFGLTRVFKTCSSSCPGERPSTICGMTMVVVTCEILQ